MNFGLMVRTARTPLSATMAAALAALSLGLPLDAFAQARANVQAGQSASVERPAPRAQPRAGRYVSESGQAFILDRWNGRTLLRFERSTEIWVLRPAPAPRGDVIYRNDNGDQILRVTPDGGITLYTTTAPRGAPVSMSGEAPSLAAPALNAVQLWNFIVRQSDRASRALGRLVVVDVDIRPGSEAVAADALSTATDAIARMARSPNFQQQVGQVRRIVISDQGGRAQTTFVQGTLRIVIDPDAGVAGRPSSARIVRVVAQN